MIDCDDCPGCPTTAINCGGINVKTMPMSSQEYRDKLDFNSNFYILEIEKHGYVRRRPEGGEQGPRGTRMVLDHWQAVMSKRRVW